MREITLRYGCNPHQGSAKASASGPDLPLRVRNGEPSYINLLDALTGWQLVRELRAATGLEAAASYKHVSPAGAAVAGPISSEFARAQLLDGAPEDAVTRAYLRARAADRVSSFGDVAAISDTVTPELAQLLKREVSDCIIAPGFDPQALDILRSKKSGRYVVLEIDAAYEPPLVESREIFGIRLQQERDRSAIVSELFQNALSGPLLQPSVVQALTVATISLKFTQSNSVAIAWNGQIIGMAGGQQSRIHCTRLACAKAETWMLQTHPKVLQLAFQPGLSRTDRYNAVDQFIRWDELTAPERSALRSQLAEVPEPITPDERQKWFSTFEGQCMSSDAFIPFRDNIDRAAQTGVRYIAHAGGALRDETIRHAAEECGVTLLETGIRCFLH